MIKQETVTATMPDGRNVRVVSPRGDQEIHDGCRWSDKEHADPIGVILTVMRLGRTRYGFRYVNAVFPPDAFRLMLACDSVRGRVAAHICAGHIKPPVNMAVMRELLPMWLDIPRDGIAVNPDGGRAVWLYTAPDSDGPVQSAVVRYAV